MKNYKILVSVGETDIFGAGVQRWRTIRDHEDGFYGTLAVKNPDTQILLHPGESVLVYRSCGQGQRWWEIITAQNGDYTTEDFPMLEPGVGKPEGATYDLS